MIIMAKTAAKRYIKHPKTALAEVFKIAIDYAHEALKTLGGDKVLDKELRQEVQKVIDEKLPAEKYKVLRELINLHFKQGKRVEEAAKLLNISIPQAYGWLADIKLVVADEMYLCKVLIETYRPELVKLLKTDPDMVAAVAKANNLRTVRDCKTKA